MASNQNQVTSSPDGVDYQLEEVVITGTPGSPFSIDRFVGKVAGVGGLAKTNRFKVSFGVEDIDFYCESAEFPGRSLNTSDSRIYGPIYKTPFESVFQEVNLTFLCDVNLTQKFYFDQWFERINPSKNPSGRDFDLEYRDNYVKDVEISQLAETGITTYSVKLYNAFPTTIGSLQMNWGDDQFHKLQITLAYDYSDQYVYTA